MIKRHLEKIARENIERHLGDVVEEGNDIYEEAYVLGFDALVDAGVDAALAGAVATKIAKEFV